MTDTQSDALQDPRVGGSFTIDGKTGAVVRNIPEGPEVSVNETTKTKSVSGNDKTTNIKHKNEVSK